MANIAAVSRTSRPKKNSKPRNVPVDLHEEDLEDLYWDALVGAKKGDMNAAESFADRLVSLFNATPVAGLGNKSPDDAYAALARKLGLVEGLGIRGAL